MGIYEIDEKKFMVNVGNVSKIDVSIDAISKDVYSPLDNVTIEVLTSSILPTDFEVVIPEINYSLPLHVENQTTLNITLPKFAPGRYSLIVQAVKDGEILDADVVEFTVKALGVEILAFNVKKLYYNPNETIVFNITLTDLEGNFVDANVSLDLFTPSGGIIQLSTLRDEDHYRTEFTPTENGTYSAKAYAYKEGWVVRAMR